MLPRAQVSLGGQSLRAASLLPFSYAEPFHAISWEDGGIQAQAVGNLLQNRGFVILKSCSGQNTSLPLPSPPSLIPISPEKAEGLPGQTLPCWSGPSCVWDSPDPECQGPGGISDPIHLRDEMK